MARLIHLNGPPAIGKTTIAERYADDHPGVLNLDADRLHPLVGGWRTRFSETGKIVRPLALAMARAQLTEGRDVVMPQYVGNLTQLARFEDLAHDCGAQYVLISLMDTVDSAVTRFDARDTTPHDKWLREVVEHRGGVTHLRRLYEALTAVLEARPDAIVIDTRHGAIDDTYAAVIAALAPGT